MSSPSWNSDVDAAGVDPSAIFAALGDRTRLGLIDRLCDGQARSIAQLTTGSGLTRQAMTKHLRVLERAGLVRSNRVGRESHFRYRPESIDGARTYLETIGREWDEALSRLQAFVENEPTPPHHE